MLEARAGNLSVVLSFYIAPIPCPLKAYESSRIGSQKWVRSLNNPAQNYQIMFSYEMSGSFENRFNKFSGSIFILKK